MAARVSAGFTRRPVATSNTAWLTARRARMERAIWTRTAALATRPPPPAPPLRVAERGRGGEVSPPMPPLLVLIVAVLATTYAGPIVRFATASAVAIAFWRLALVLPVTGALAWGEGRGERSDSASDRPTAHQSVPHPSPLSPFLMVLSRLLLALHFWSWIASLRFTTVASSVVLVSLKPVFAWGIAALWLREHPGRAERWGIVLAVLGASLIGLGDARLSLGALSGDALALCGAVTGAGYYVIGRRVRPTVGIWRYATVVYAVAAAALALFALARTTPLVGFARRDWAVFGAMAAGPMLVGHTGMNYALRHFRATTVNVAARKWRSA